MIHQRRLTPVVLMLAVIFVALACHDDHDIDISISDTDDEVVLVAYYPDKDSKRVQDYVRSKLNMTDISDFHYLEVKYYQTPDQRMKFNIKSRDGYLKIVLDKRENRSRSFAVLKETAKGLQEVLTRE